METPKRIAILEDDEVTLKLIASFAKKLGFEAVDTFTMAEDLWARLSEVNYDGIVMDWQLPGELSGLALYNRLRKHAEASVTPILVCSGTVQLEDFALLKEFPCSDLLPKPITYERFEKSFNKVWDEYLWYEDHFEDLKMLTEALETKAQDAVKHVNRIVRDCPNPLPASVMIGKLLLQDGKLEEAKLVFEKLLKVDKLNVACLTGLGKIALLKGDSALALDTLKRAQEISPHNMERLCLLGSIHLEKMSLDDAKDVFDQALQMDGADKLATAGITVVENVKAFFKESNKSVSVPTSFASLMNTTAVAKVRLGYLKEGIEQYLAALYFVTTPTDKARLMFNIGLGHLKGKNHKEALRWFDHSAKVPGADFKRSKQLVKRLEEARIKKTAPSPPPAFGLPAADDDDHTEDVDLPNDEAI